MKPGQLYTYKNQLYRAKRRELGCKGCYFRFNPFLCPGCVPFKQETHKRLDCWGDNIILVKVK